MTPIEPRLTPPSRLEGILTGLTQPTPEKLREAIREMRTLTDKPFAVNLVSRDKEAGWSAWGSRRVSC